MRSSWIPVPIANSIGSTMIANCLNGLARPLMVSKKRRVPTEPRSSAADTRFIEFAWDPFESFTPSTMLQ